MVLYQPFWAKFKKEMILFATVYITCLLLALLFNLVSFGAEPLKLSVPLHQAPRHETFMLQALAPLPVEKTEPTTLKTPNTDTTDASIANVVLKKKP